MSRTVAEKRPAEESFSGLLNRITLDRLSADRVTLSGQSQEERKDGSRRSIALARSMAAGAKTVRKTNEPVELSYEKALQRHSRRRPAEEIDFDLPVNAGTAVTAEVAPASSTIRPIPRNTKKDDPATQSAVSPRLRNTPASLSEKGLPRRSPGEKVNGKTGTGSRTKAGGGGRGASGSIAGSISTTHAARRRETQAKSASPPSLTPGSKPESKSGPKPSVRRNTKSTRKRNAVPSSPSMAAIGQLMESTPKTEGAALRRGSGIALERVATRLAEQRREIVSVRLSEDESHRLRLRAAESGISVSAYMRSCVLDADHLRAQVKQALLEMRASVRRPETSCQTPGQPAMHLTGNSSESAAGGFSGSWLRLISRSAALLLAPLLSLRHRV